MKRLFALFLALAILGSLLPAESVRAAEPEAQVLTQADYAQVDAVFDAIDAAEAAPAKRDESQASKTEAAMALVMASDSYVEGSLIQSGTSFTWWTDSGIRCIYNPRMRQLRENMTPENGIDEIVNEPAATKGGTPASKQVYLIGPYYGYDNSFTNQYKTEARRVAQAIGDTDGYTLYSGEAATIDKVAEAVQNGAVVFFDSHGATDYENPNNEDDCITEATGSWLCLSSKEGLTDADYDDGAAWDGENAFVNGDVIANHMTQNSPNGILWMAICFGMGTDTMYRPLRAKGVEVVYGYSEAVTFAGDYLYEEAFWDEMIQGKTVAESIATMKNTWGQWDYSTQIASYYNDYGYSTISAARADFIAFPWVISSEDTYYPGQRTASSYGADSLQTVQSTYSLGEVQEVTNPTDPGQILTEAYALTAGEELPYEATLTGVITQVTTAYNATYGNVTVIMAVPGYESMPIKCYRLSGSGADQIGVGDTITVTGTIVNYQHSSGDTEVEFAQGCTLDSWIDGGTTETPDTPETPETPEVPAGEGVTLSFASTANRTELSTERQIWQQDGITLTNEKASSSSNVADYANPARFYKGSSLEIEYPGMVKFVAICDSATYATAFSNSITGATASVSGSEVTVTLPAAADSFFISSLSAQVRMDSITVYAAAETEPEEPDVPVEPEEPTLPSVLTEDTEIEITLTEDLYIDLAGYSLSGTITLNGFKIYGKDSSTDEYDGENAGLFTCVDENGELIVPEQINSDGYQHYLTVSEEEGYSFHRFDLGITHMSLEPQVVGLGYKAVVSGDDAVMAQLTEEAAFTFRLQLDGYNPVYRYYDRQELVSGDPIVLRIRNYGVENYSETKLYAQVSLQLQNGVVIHTEEEDLTFRWLTEQVDANYSNYTDDQIAQFKALLEQFEVVKTWNLPNLFPAAVTSATLDLSDTANRLSWDGTQQIWSQNGITLTNNKNTSTTAIANYVPIRLYQGSEVIIRYAGMRGLEFDCTGQNSKYVTALYNSLCTISGAAVTQSGSVITVTLTAAADSVTFVMTAQGRAAALTVYK